MRYLSGLACGLALVAANAAAARQAVQETRTTTSTPAGTRTEIRRVSQIIGSPVRLRGNTDFGKVEDIVLNESGGVDYIVVNHGGRYAMLPWGAANVNYGQKTVTYEVAPDAVQPLLFAQDAWPNTTDEQFTTRMTKVFPNVNATARPLPGGVSAEGGVVGPDGAKVKIKERPGKTKVKIKDRD